MIYQVRNSKTDEFVIETGDPVYANFVCEEMNAHTGTFNYVVVPVSFKYTFGECLHSL